MQGLQFEEERQLMNAAVKINFKIAQDDDGYPPVAVESLWATPVGGHFVVDSIPFFTRDATVGDLVRAVPDSTGSLWFEGIEHASQSSLIRVVFFKTNYDESVAKRLKALGCGTEGMRAYKLLAIDVPAGVDLADVQDFLRSEALADRLDYEEALLRH